MSSAAQRMLDLFESNTKSHGVYRKSGAMHTEHSPVTIQDFRDHLNGKTGLGLAPINDLNGCKWGVIDIDCHGEQKEIDLQELYAAVEEAGYPLMVCRSKSGGAHLYLFMQEMVDAKSMRANLRLMANRLNHPGVEVFPKQDNLDGDKLGNWINLPYFDAKETVRYCFAGKPMNLTYFLETAEAMRVAPGALEGILLGDHSEAPPCVQQMMTGQVPPGYRNEAMFGIAIYMKQAFPDDWRDKMRDVNTTALQKPLQSKEVETILGSVSRRTYKYRCQEEPCKSFCQAKVCLTRKYGIKEDEDPQEGERLGIQMMEIRSIVKVQTEPPIYYVDVCGKPVKVKAEQLYNPMAMCVVMLEQADMIVYPMKPKDWHNMLAEALQTLKMEVAPEDASEAGMIRIRLREFLKKARDGATDEESKEFLAHGQPVIIEDEGVRYVYFKGTSFVDYLRRTKSSLMRGPDLWSALRSAGVEHTRMRVNRKPTALWRARFEPEEAYAAVNTENEF